VSGGDYLAAAYVIFLVLVLAYLAIMAAKVARLERDVAELADALGQRHEDASGG
jgi:type II secretory pathway component PulM